jgi:hypothetical protein
MKRKIALFCILAGLLLLASCRLDNRVVPTPLGTPTVEPACEWPCASDLATMTAEMALTFTAQPRIFTPTPTWAVGDLGWGQVRGMVRDTLTGAPVAGAWVTCEHFSYNTYYKHCSGKAATNIDGSFVFENVFFHDTDRITLTVELPGYVTQVFHQDFFTQPTLVVNISLPLSTGWTPAAGCTPPPCSPDETLVCLSGNCPGGCELTCVAATISATPTPMIMCTAPACPSDVGELTCGLPEGCPGGCGTICATYTPYVPQVACTAPACPGGVLACGNPDGCPGGCGTVCLTPTP